MIIMNDAIVLVGHGSRRAEANSALERLCRLVAEDANGHEKHAATGATGAEADAKPTLTEAPGRVEGPMMGLKVEAAFLQFASPDLATVIERMIADGYRGIVVVPVFLYEGAHATRDIPAIIEAQRRAHPDVRLTVSPVLGVDRRIAAMVWDRIGEAVETEPSE